MFWSLGCLSFVWCCVVIRLKNVSANACFHSFSSCSSDGFASICMDKTGVGDVIFDEMEEMGLGNVKGMVLTDRWKEETLTFLKLLMEQKKLGILSDDAELIAQINEQQCEYFAT